MNAAQNNLASLRPAVGAQDYAPDSRRKHVLWVALSIIGFLGLALVLLVCYGTEAITSDYSEPMLLVGLLAGNLNIDRISDLVVEALVAQVHADAASLVLLDKAKGEYFHRHSTGPLAEAADGPGLPEQIARAAADGEPAIRMLNPDDLVARQLEAWGKMRAAISAPIHASELIGGTLAAIREPSFSTEDLNVLTTLANMAGKAIESAELHEQLRQNYFRTLHVLARSLSARDPYSAAHGEAVTVLAVGIAEKLGLSGEVTEALRAYGPLHDLGKIGIPDSVLLKRGPLTDEELELCRQHTVIGESIIRPLKPGPVVLAMIRNHHERWDGGGYPDGLRGGQIPIVARVVAAADAFHAIVSHRSYRAGAIPFDAVREIKTLAGAQFDPGVVQALVELWDIGELADFGIQVSEPVELDNISALPASLCAPPAYVH